MIPTANTDECRAIRELVDTRGSGFVLGFFRDTSVTPQDLAAVYHGTPVDGLKWIVVKAVLKERLTRD